MSFAAFDTPSDLSGQGPCIIDAGYHHVLLYARSDRAPAEMVADIRNAGLRVAFVFETGHPDHTEYFTTDQATADATDAVGYACKVSLPAGLPIFFAADFDPSEDDVNGPVTDYFRTVHTALDTAGYRVGCYGSGLCIRVLVAEGVCHYGWLSESGDFGETKAARDNPSAYSLAVIQEPTDNSFAVCGASADKDIVLDDSVFF